MTLGYIGDNPYMELKKSVSIETKAAARAIAIVAKYNGQEIIDDFTAMAKIKGDD